MGNAKNKEVANPALKDVESTAKALEGVRFNANFNLPLEQSKNARQVAEAYHKAKADGSNPELVAAVEELLNDNRTTNEANQPVPLNKGNEPIRYEDAIKITPTSILTNPEQYGVDELGIEAKAQQ